MTEEIRPRGRLESLDAFRGLTIAGMILVNNPGSWSHVYPPLLHATWNGWTPTDLIFPFFLFIMGVAIPFSFARRLAGGDSRGVLFRHILRRSLILFGLGLFMAGFPRFELDTLRIMGVLQRIGVVYLFTASAYLVLGRWGRGAALSGLLLGYWALMTRVPVPGFGAGDLSPEGNLAAFLDRLFLGEARLWQGTWDPEGLLSTLPAMGTTLLGIYAGEWIRAGDRMARVASGLLAGGVCAVLLGWGWGLVFPINKALWTSSYVLFTAGAGSVLLGVMFWVMEVRGWKGWARPLVVYGMNAIAVFVASGLLARVMGLVRVGSGVTVKGWIVDNLFVSWAGPLNGSLAFAVTYVLFWLGLMWLLHRRGIFIKV